MLNCLNKFSSAAWKLVCHGRQSLYNFEIPTPSYKRGSVCPFTNISSREDKITGVRKDKRLTINSLDVIYGSTKGNTDDVYLNNSQKCKFHSSLTHSNKYEGHGKYQDPEKKRANVLIFLTFVLAASVLWGAYKTDMSPYDKPVKKAEKL